jgi:hypothetical protein
MNPHMRELQTAFAVERIWDWRLVLFPERMPKDLPFYDLLNVRYYLGPKDDLTPGENGLRPVANADLSVWRSETAWPRAFFTNRVATYNTVEDFVALVRAGDRRPLAAVQGGERGVSALLRGDLAGRTVVPATDYRLTNNTTSFVVQAASAGVIVLSEAWLTDEFTATVNGQSTPLFRVNHAFKGLEVPRGGTYEISIRYRPRHFNLALGFCVLGLVGTGGVTWWTFKRYPVSHPTVHAG